MSIKFNIKGLNDFNRNIEKSSKWFDHAMKQALELSGKEVKTRARAIVPIDTGRLKKSINYQPKKRSVAIGPDTAYDIFVEEGTFKMRAQPYMKPGLARSEKRIVSFIEEGIEHVLNRITR